MVKAPRPKPEPKAVYLVLRRNTGEIVLTTAGELSIERDYPPSVHSRNCNTKPPYAQHQVTMGGKWDEDEHRWIPLPAVPCPCACHTAKGRKTWRAAMAAWKKLHADPRHLRFSIAGGTSAGMMLVRRLRAPAPEHHRALLALDRQIWNLQKRRNLLVKVMWPKARVLTPRDLDQLARKAGRTPTHYVLSGRLDARWAFPEAQHESEAE